MNDTDMHIGTAIFLVALICFAIAYPGFRKVLFVGAAIAAALILIAIANNYDNNGRQNATYRPTTYQVATPTPAPQALAPAPQVPPTQAPKPPVMPGISQNRSCRLESSFRAACVGPGC
jgi:hypothetical protein